MLRADGRWLRVERVEARAGRRTVYNLEVEDFHTYVVGQLGAWVHNTCNPNAVAKRVFSSTDPLVADLANTIEAAYPGHVVGVNVAVKNVAGQLVTDADILLKNAIIQVKSGAGKGLTDQVLRTQSATSLPVIGYGPQLGGALFRGMQKLGLLVTRDKDLLVQIVSP